MEFPRIRRFVIAMSKRADVCRFSELLIISGKGFLRSFQEVVRDNIFVCIELPLGTIRVRTVPHGLPCTYIRLLDAHVCIYTCYMLHVAHRSEIRGRARWRSTRTRPRIMIIMFLPRACLIAYARANEASASEITERDQAKGKLVLVGLIYARIQESQVLRVFALELPFVVVVTI